MTQYRYRALTSKGDIREDIIEAISREDVVSKLRANDFFPVDVTRLETEAGRYAHEAPAGNAAVSGMRGRLAEVFRGGKKTQSRSAIAVFTRELQVLIDADISLEQALSLISGTGAVTMADIVDDIRERLREGETLSAAMAGHPQLFDDFYRSMIQAGESANALKQTLSHLADYLERGDKLIGAVRSALIYPAILAVAALLSFVLLMIFVVPQFALLFRESATPLPFITKLVIGASAFLREYGWTVLAALAVMTIVACLYWKNPLVSLKGDGLLLRLGIIGPVVAKISFERFSRALATLLASGLPLIEALQLARKTISNKVLSNAVAVSTERVKQGGRLGQSLSSENVFPPLAVQLIRIGEESGRLESMLLKLADIYQSDVESSLKRWIVFLEPALIILIGLFIAVVVISLISALMGINTLAI